MGMLDPRFFIYYEETDWCVRASQAGYRIVYVPAANMWHKVSSAMKADSPITAYYMHRNVLLFLRKSLPIRYAVPAIIRQLGYQFRIIIALTVRKKHKQRRSERNARVQAILDFALGRYGRKSL